MSVVTVHANKTISDAFMKFENNSIWENCVFKDCCLQADKTYEVTLIECIFYSCTFTGDGWPKSIIALSE